MYQHHQLPSQHRIQEMDGRVDAVPGGIMMAPQHQNQQIMHQQHHYQQQIQSGRLSPVVGYTTATTIIDPRAVSPTHMQLHPLQHQPQPGPHVQYINRAPSPVIAVQGPPSQTVLTYTPSPSHVSLQPLQQQQPQSLQLQLQPQQPTPSTGTTTAIIHSNPMVVNSIPGRASPGTYNTIVYASSPSHQGMPLIQTQLQQQYLQQQPQPTTQLIVIDPLSLPSMFQDRQIKMDYVRKVLGVLFTQIGICFLIVNVFNMR